jgi:hypothetical protein
MKLTSSSPCYLPERPSLRASQRCYRASHRIPAAMSEIRRRNPTECEYCKVLQVQRFIEGMGSEIDFVDDNFILVDGSLWQIIVDQGGCGELWVNFHVNTDPAFSARIMDDLSRLSSALNMPIRVGDSYAFNVNEKGKVSNMTFGDKAYETVGRKRFDILP